MDDEAYKILSELPDVNLITVDENMIRTFDNLPDDRELTITKGEIGAIFECIANLSLAIVGLRNATIYAASSDEKATAEAAITITKALNKAMTKQGNFIESIAKRSVRHGG